MDYQTWLNIIDKIKSGNNSEELLNTLKNAPINNNINELIIPKVEELIKTRFEKRIITITNDLDNIFNDSNYLDLILVNLKKEITFLLEICNLKQLDEDTKNNLKLYLVNKTEQVYDILLKEAKRIDYTGIYEMTIKNNKMKWSK